MLRGEHHRVHAHGLVLLVVLDGHLRLAVGTEIVHELLLAHFGETLCQLVREGDRQRHPLRRLVAGVAEHHALIARAVVERVRAVFLALQRLIHAQRDVAALLVDVRHDGAGLAVEAVLCAVIADLAHDLPHGFRDVHIAVGRDLAHDVHDAGRHRALAGDAAVRVFFQDRVQHRVGDLVANFVRMSLRDRFRSKQMMCHSIEILAFASFLHKSLAEFARAQSKMRSADPAERMESRDSLIFRFTPPDLAPCKCRLPGFTGPVPPPLLIRHVQLQTLLYRFFTACQGETANFPRKLSFPSATSAVSATRTAFFAAQAAFSVPAAPVCVPCARQNMRADFPG